MASRGSTADLAILALGIVGAALAPAWRSTMLFLGLVGHATVLHTLGSGFHRHRLYLALLAILYAAFLLSRSRGERRGLVTVPRLACAVSGVGVFLALVAAGDHTFLLKLWRGSFGA